MNSAELKIRELLNDNVDVTTAARAISKSWRKNLFDPKEQFVVAQFFLNSGLVTSFLREVEHLLDEEKYIPWAQVSECLGDLQIVPSSDEQKAIVEGLKTQEALSEVLRSQKADRLSSRIVKARAQNQARELEKQNEAKLALREKIEFLRSQRMMEDEEKALRQYHKTYPDDQEESMNQKSFDERWARHVVGENADHRLVKLIFEEKPIPIAKDQVVVRDLMVARAKDILKKDSKKNYDLAMTLAFMDFFDEALDILRSSDRTPDAEWFELELLIKSRKFLDALELSQQLEVKFVDDPESTFAAIYARARALWGLGQKAQAIDFMKSIVKVKAQYKNAHSLLNHWMGQS